MTAAGSLLPLAKAVTDAPHAGVDTNSKTPFGLIVLLWIAGLCAAAQFAKISLIFPELATLYPEAGAAAGFLVSLLSFIGMLLGLFAGIIVARVGFRPLLLAALLFGALLSAWQATLPAFPMMLVSRLLEGGSHLAVVVIIPTMIAQLAEARHRSAALTLWGTFFGVAFALVAWFGLPLVKAYGTASLFALHAIATLAVTVALFILLPRTVQTPAEEAALTARDVWQRHLRTYASPSLAAPALGWLFYTLSFVSILTILPSFVEPGSRSWATGVMPLAGIATSMTAGVLLMRFMSAIAVTILGFILAGACVSLFLLFPGEAWVGISLFAALGLVQGSSFAAVPQLNSDAQSQAYANGALAQMGNLGNLSGTPVLLMMTAALGLHGLVIFALACFAGGILVHLALATRRRGFQF